RAVALHGGDILRREKHGTLASAPVVATLLDTLEDDLHQADWARIAAAVDAVDEARLQWSIPLPMDLENMRPLDIQTIDLIYGCGRHTEVNLEAYRGTEADPVLPLR
ncbi:hypothetical protein, partial [Pseudomonas sp.]|uniref:hypothetical protein n=1 Tax=Pseudomonas sp. TaxID=306 RepID=UPI0032DAE1E8